jgi:hypothetical protein
VKHGTTRAEAPLPALALNWQAPSAMGGGGPEEAEGKPPLIVELLAMALPGAIAQVATLVLLLDRMEPGVPDAERATDDDWIVLKAAALAWLGEWGERFKASGLTAEHELALFAPRMLRGAEDQTSGLTAESNEAACGGGTPVDEQDGAAIGEPVGAGFAAMLQQLGRRPC